MVFTLAWFAKKFNPGYNKNRAMRELGRVWAVSVTRTEEAFPKLTGFCESNLRFIRFIRFMGKSGLQAAFSRGFPETSVFGKASEHGGSYESGIERFVMWRGGGKRLYGGVVHCGQCSFPGLGAPSIQTPSSEYASSCFTPSKK
jgi:hypothetical protein